MAKLFITPTHGKLGSVIDNLKDNGYNVEVIGYGYPPIYVEVEKREFPEIEKVVKEVDSGAEFSAVRFDLVRAAELTSILQKLGVAGITTLCNEVNIVPDTLNGYSSSNVPNMAAGLVNQFTKSDKLPELAAKAYEIWPDYF